MIDDPILELRHIEILEHALGITNRRIPANITRRSFVAEKGTAAHRDCLDLVNLDYMREVHTGLMEDDLEMFRVTDECIELLRIGEKLKRLIEGEHQETSSPGAAAEPANRYTMRPDMPDTEAAQMKKRAAYLQRRSAQCLEQMTLNGRVIWLQDLLTAIGDQANKEHLLGSHEFFSTLADRIAYRLEEDQWDVDDND